jgi:hypothetical protein
MLRDPEPNPLPALPEPKRWPPLFDPNLFPTGLPLGSGRKDFGAEYGSAALFEEYAEPLNPPDCT